MANRYWVGGNANWDATAGTKWATTSGGAGGSAVPTAADDVFLDNGAGTGNVTIAANVVCRSLNCTGYIGILTYDTNARTLTIGDATAGAGNVALKFVPGMTYTILGNTNTITFASTTATTQSVDWGSKTAGNVTFSGSTGRWQFVSGSVAGTLNFASVGAAVLDINSQTCSWGTFSGITGTIKTLTLGSASITLSGDWSWRTGQTITANNATVTQTGASAGFDNNSAAGMDYNGMSLVQSGAGNAIVGGGSPQITLVNYTRTATVLTTDGLLIGATVNFTVTNTLTLNGNSAANRLWVQGGVGVPRTVTCNGTISASYVDFGDIAGAGSASWNLSAITGGCGDTLGNSGITFTTPTTRYGVAAGNWSDTAMWSTTPGGAPGASPPLPQDNAILDASSGAGTYTMNMNRMCADLTCTGFTRTLTMATSSSSRFIFGSLTLGSGMTFTVNGNFSLAGRGTHTITFAGKVGSVGANRGYGIGRAGGSYTLLDDMTVGGVNTGTNGISIAACTFNANNFNIAAAVFAIGSDATINMGSGTWTITDNGAANIWNGAGTINANSSTIVISPTSASTRTFIGGGKTYNNLTYTVAGSTGQLSITGSNTFNNLNFSDITNARTLAFTAGTTTSITGSFNVNGTSGKLMTIGSITAASHTLAMPTGVSCDYLSISRSTLTGNSAYAGANSFDGGNNSTSPGWIFTSPPNSSSNMIIMFT